MRGAVEARPLPRGASAARPAAEEDSHPASAELAERGAPRDPCSPSEPCPASGEEIAPGAPDSLRRTTGVVVRGTREDSEFASTEVDASDSLRRTTGVVVRGVREDAEFASAEAIDDGEADAEASNDDGAFQLTGPEAQRVDAVVCREYKLVWRSLRRFGVEEALADDATQTVFMTFARRLEDVEPGRERAFLIGVCHRVAANVRRRSARRQALFREPLRPDFESTSNPEELLESKQRLEWLDRALDQLRPDQRAVFVLYEIEGFSLSEMADALQIPLGTVSSRLRRARERFQHWAAIQRRRQRGCP